MTNVNVISNDTYYLIGSEETSGFRAINISPHHVNNQAEFNKSIEICKREGRHNAMFAFVFDDLSLVEHAINYTRQQGLKAVFLVEQPLEYSYFICNGLFFASKKHSRHGFYDILSRLSKIHDLPQGMISDREMEVLGMLLSGVETKEIAQRLEISSKTVSAHKKKIARRFGMDNWNDALMYKYLTMIVDRVEPESKPQQAAQPVPVHIPHWHEEQNLPKVEALPVVGSSLAAVENIAGFRF
jgi:DNA-binding CsgD family transcriptional regulator